jgi:4-amino-4-deoxy-L-arabinose transferase-like glycosyltransferase
MDAVGFSESAPPLYYALAWLWTQLTGTGEVGLRSLSALAGAATIPVAYLAAAELRGSRAGVAAAALAAFNPMLLWYSQEARAYSLLSLLTALCLLYFLRALRRGRRADVRAWGVCAGLAFATHYFALFPIALEGGWLLRRRGRAALPGLRIVAAVGVLLAPLLVHQASIGHAEWIGNHALAHRLWEGTMTFATGETGEIIARPDRPLLAAAPLALALAAFALLLWRGERRERQAGAGVPLAVAAATVGVPVALALVAPSKDYVLARNMIPALVPLLVALGIALTTRAARRLGAALGVLLVAYGLAFCIAASSSESLQRPDWRAVAGELGEASAPRATVTWLLGQAPLRYYLATGAFQAYPREGFDWLVHEIDFVSDGAAPPVPASLLGPAFEPRGLKRSGRLEVRRYAVRGRGVAPLRLRKVRRADLGFRTNGVLVDGIGPQ